MREIKFRAWFSRSDLMLKVEEITWEPKDRIFIKGIVDKGMKIVGRVGENGVYLMQYTGLKDKNGVEIYEGDIVKCVPNAWSKLLAEPPDLTRDASTIEYFHGMFHLCQKYHGREPIEDYLDGRQDEERAFLEVIGNIYENPALLETK